MRKKEGKTVNLYVFIIFCFGRVYFFISLCFFNQFETEINNNGRRKENDHHRKSQQTMRKRNEKRAFMVINGVHTATKQFIELDPIWFSSSKLFLLVANSTPKTTISPFLTLSRPFGSLCVLGCRHNSAMVYAWQANIWNEFVKPKRKQIHLVTSPDSANEV